MDRFITAWGRILRGYRPTLSIEITRECPLRCPGCYAYGDDHLGGAVTLRQVTDYKGQELIDRVLAIVDQEKRYVELVAASRAVTTEVAERSRQMQVLSEELARSSTLKDEMLAELDRVQSRQRDTVGQVQRGFVRIPSMRTHMSCHGPEHRQYSTHALVQRGDFPKFTKFHGVRSQRDRVAHFFQVGTILGYRTILTNLG